MKILIIEVDKKTSSFIRKGLKQAGYAVDRATDGEEGFYLLSSEPYDACIVDVMLPKMDGLTLVKSIREQKINTPVIFLGVKRNTDDVIKGFHVGGDDYLVKPFSFAELLARLQALIRRSTYAVEPGKLSSAGVEIDLLNHRVSCEGRVVDLQPREFAILEYLMRNAGRVVSQTIMIEHAWDYHFDPGTNVVEVCICRLRRKLREEFGKNFIRTVRGVGYVFEPRSAKI